MNLQSNDFVLFGVPERFAQDPQVLRERWQALQGQAHPDRFAAQGVAAQRLAMQWSVRINEAFARLKDPLQRAVYLCELHGATLNAESNTAMPSSFLMQQMVWRETLEEAKTTADLDALMDQQRQFVAGLQADVAQLLDASPDYPAAAQRVRQWLFVEKFAADIDKAYERLGG